MAGGASGVHPIPTQGQEVGLYLERWGFGLRSTAGWLWIPGRQEPVAVLEDYARPLREEKVPGETAIPYGRYQLGLRLEGGFHQRYSSRFPSMHKGMIELLAVPGFKWILMHCGNQHEDTRGCLLLGSAIDMSPGYEFYVRRSEDAYRSVYPEILGLIKKGPVSLRIGRRAE